MKSVEYPPRQNYFDFFANLLRDRVGEAKQVLEIGSGATMHPALAKYRDCFQHLTGIDPSNEVFENKMLDEQIHSPFESYDFQSRQYDFAFAFNVMEHIESPEKFFEQLHQVIRPGGWFWALAPHANHPFAKLSRLAEVAGLKSRYRQLLRREDGYLGINDYSSFYRANSVRSIERFMRPPRNYFDKAEFFLMDAGWDSYFPTGFKWIARTYDQTISRTWKQYRLIIVYGIQVAPVH